MLKPEQIEVLVLERVREFMRHHRFLAIKIDPIGHMKLPRLRIVVPGDLFRQQLDNERS